MGRLDLPDPWRDEDGQIYLPEKLLRKLANTPLPTEEMLWVANEPRQKPMPLTARELTMLRYLSDGFTQTRIAAVEETALSTVESHVKNIRAKLGARNPAQAVALALRQGLIT